MVGLLKNRWVDKVSIINKLKTLAAPAIGGGNKHPSKKKDWRHDGVNVASRRREPPGSARRQGDQFIIIRVGGVGLPLGIGGG